MKQRLKKLHLMSWILSLAMVIGLLSGPVFVKKTSEAAEDATIELGEMKKEKGYYTYPDAKIVTSEEDAKSNRYRYLTVSVDSGHLMVPETAINGVSGKGLIYGDNVSVGFEDLDTARKYEAISFEFLEDDSVAKQSQIEEYIRKVKFTTTSTREQTVTITATTRGDAAGGKLTAYLDEENTIQVYYFNGHYYGYVPGDYKWTEAYKKAQQAECYGMHGYLATLTTRAEDRFLYEKFKIDTTHNMVPAGWMGCSRALPDGNGEYTILNNVTNPVKKGYNPYPWNDAQREANKSLLAAFYQECRENLVWSWVAGPEKGTVFGYQKSFLGEQVPETEYDGTKTYDGGFVTYDGFFSNWKVYDPNADRATSVEPNGGEKDNGGQFEREAYGHYGEYAYGRWNDHEDAAKKGYYIEFGGMPGDTDETGQIIYTTTQPSEDIITDEDEYGKIFNPGPYIVNKNASGNTAVGTELNADISKISFIDKANDTITYQWYIVNEVEDDNGKVRRLLEDVPNATGQTLVLSELTLGQKLAVRVFETNPDGKLVGTGISAPYETGDGVTAIYGNVAIKEDKIDDDGKLVVKADVSGVKPKDARDKLDYQWILKEGTKETPIPGATDPTFKVPDEYQGKELVVKVTPDPGSDYEGEIPSDPYKVKELITGKPAIVPDQDGVNLTADISGIGPEEANFKQDDFNYQWYVVGDDGSKTPIPGATKPEYKLTDNTIGKEIVVQATVKPSNENYSGIAQSDPYDASPETKTEIGGKPVITQTDSVLSAVVTGITPPGAQPVLEYQWYDDGTPIPGATGKTLTLTDDLLDGSQITVEVKVPEDNKQYTGSASSDPVTPIKPDTPPEKTPIQGAIVIENKTTDDAGNPINKEGTLLYANLDNVTPEGCHDALSYQWFVLEVVDGAVVSTPIPGATSQNYALTADTIDKTVAVIATADGKTYVGSVSSDPYNTARTNAGIQLPTETEDGKQIIYVTPTEEDTRYKITEINGVIPEDMTVKKITTDGKEVDIMPEEGPDEDGWYIVDPGETLKFIVEPEKNYVIREEQIKGKNTDVTSQIVDNVKAEIAADGTITITVDPARENTKYAVLKKDGDNYTPVTVNKDGSNYAFAPDSTATWSDGGEKVVTFTKLPADGTYKIVAIDTQTPDGDYVDPDISPDKLLGGSKDIVGSELKKGTGSNNNTQNFTKAEQAKADQMIKDFLTNPKDGKVVTEINDYTRDVVINGEKTWNKLTAREKAAVNAKLKAMGCKYTYEQLLAMAKKWQIPYFKINKVMKKGTKSKLKLIKCKGATVVATSSNTKVATISKKGVIKAKKVGKANCTITVIKGNYSNKLVIKVVVRKKFKNAKELKKFKSNKIKTPTILLNKQRKLKKSTKIKVSGVTKGSKVTYKSLNKKVIKVNKKGKYTAKKKGKTLIRVTVKQNGKKYLLYLYVTAHK